MRINGEDRPLDALVALQEEFARIMEPGRPLGRGRRWRRTVALVMAAAGRGRTGSGRLR
jgi:hypothetical protein